MNERKPAFITFTGVDDVVLLKGMRELSQRYPIEWGVLIDPARRHERLFPDDEQIDRIRQAGLRLSAHVCGELAQDIVTGRAERLNLGGFSRLQVNHGRDGASSDVVASVNRFAAAHGLRGVLQCNGEFPVDETRVDWLYDVSFGEGVTPDSYPALSGTFPFCGYSGGITAETVNALLSERYPVADGAAFWIDMESGVRTGGSMDLEKCSAVCRAVYDA